MKNVGIVCALHRELAPLIKRTPAGCRIVAGGIGAAAAGRAARSLEDVHVLISAGYAGGIAAPAARGMIVVDTADPELDRALPQAIRGRIADSQTMVSQRKARIRLASLTGAVAVDMESAAVAQVARERGIPFAAVRAITDGPEDDLVIQWDHYRQPDGSMRTGAAVFSALHTKQGIAELFRLWYASKEATDVLSAYLTRFLERWLAAASHGRVSQ